MTGRERLFLFDTTLRPSGRSREASEGGQTHETVARHGAST